MNKIFYFWQLCLLCFIVSSCKDTDEQPSQHTLVGKWYFVTTQEKENNQWFDFPMPLDGAEMFIEFLPDHSATIVRTVGDQVDSKNFTWELMPDGSFIVNGETEGRLDFSGNNRFYWQTTTTNDSFTGKVLEGLFRDVYDRNPTPADNRESSRNVLKEKYTTSAWKGATITTDWGWAAICHSMERPWKR